MSANVETMFSVREKPWHGLGTIVDEALNAKDAMVAAGLDWEVLPKKICVEGTTDPIPNAVANVRSSDGKVLGIVADRYKIVQNADAFAFTDELVGSGDVKYETAGSLNGGKKVWLLAKMPDTKILDDEIEPYICFSNVHDGTGAVRVCMTPIRVVCNNTLNFALSTAKRSWSAVHAGDMDRKIAEAREALGLAEIYMGQLNKYAESMVDVKIDEDKIKSILDKMFPINTEDSKCKQENAKVMQDAFMACYFAPDIVQFKGTAWGALNAMTDMVGHMTPNRLTQNYAENNWGRIMNGHKYVDEMANLLVAA